MKFVYLLKEDDELKTSIIAAYTSEEAANSAKECCEKTAEHGEEYSILKTEIDPVYI